MAYPPTEHPETIKPGASEAARVPGLTLRAVIVSIFSMLLLAILIQQGTVHLGMEAPEEFALPVPAMGVLLVLLAMGAVFAKWMRLPIITKPELICVVFTMLIAAPLMTQGFWHRIVSVIATIPREGDWEKIDALSDRLWPHGPNVLQGTFHPDNAQLSGDHRWTESEVEPGLFEKIPVLENSTLEELSRIRIRLPLREAGRAELMLAEPHLITVLVRPTGLGADAYYYCRIYPDESPMYTEVFLSRRPARITYQHQGGFLRTGNYGVPVPPEAREFVTVEYALSGPGKLELRDPKLMNVSALESVFTGKMLVTETEFAGLAPEERAGTIVRPDHLFSLRGLKFFLSGYIPIADWLEPLSAWGALILLVLSGTLCINVIMRRKWLETERYSLPLTRIPLALIGADGENIWRNRVMWAGFGASLGWGLLRGWNFYNPAVPDTNVMVALQPYFGEGWGGMWDGVEFRVLALLVAVAVFIELNILLSIVVGFFLFRAIYWFGHVSAVNVNPGFPFAQEQQVGAFLTYAVLILFFSRKYLWQVLWHRPAQDAPAASRELMSHRSAFLLLGLILLASVLWAAWIGVSASGMLCFLIFLLLVGFVSAKLRAEAGLPFGYFTPNNAAIILLLLGGITSFGPSMLLLALIANFFISVAGFFLIPGAQLELIELGRRFHIPARHIVATIFLGVMGGLILGGWVFLSNAYALGGDSLRHTWAFQGKPWYFNEFNSQLVQATGEITGVAPVEGGSDPSVWAYGFGAAGTTVLVVLRQLFAGFWFHPIGFVLGPSHMTKFVWGSFLVAWVLRLIVVKFGGADSVKNRLQPFFVGVFAGAVCSMLWWGIYGTWLSSRSVELIYGAAQ